MEVQELVARARILFGGANKRFQAFQAVNGKKSAKEIARVSGRSQSATLNDLQKMKDLELIRLKKDDSGGAIKKEGSVVYEKNPILKHLSKSYFSEPTKIPRRKSISKKRTPRETPLRVPSDKEILDICQSGEDQLYEFKEAGANSRKIVKEIGAFANTQNGGVIFYGVQDDGTIANADIARQAFDQKIQNAVRNMIAPSLLVSIEEKDVLGHKIMLIRIPPRNKRNVYLYENRAYVRIGTNVFLAKPNQLSQLYAGKHVV